MSRPVLALAVSAWMLVAFGLRVRGAEPSTSAFTAQQAESGRIGYAQHCASCHMPDLSGSNDAPELAGPNFKSAWQTKTTIELLDYVSGAMPPGGATLDAKAYASIVAHILRTNGAEPGMEPLSRATNLAIGAVITVQSTARRESSKN
jgi:mono/diheme cytochrome c family protein